MVSREKTMDVLRVRPDGLLLYWGRIQKNSVAGQRKHLHVLYTGETIDRQVQRPPPSPPFSPPFSIIGIYYY